MKRIILIFLISVLYLSSTNAQLWNPYNNKFCFNPYNEKHLTQASGDELKFLLRRMKTGKVISIISIVAGPAITYYGFAVLSENDNIGIDLVAVSLIIPFGIGLTIVSIPGIIIANSRIKRINYLINKSPPASSLSIRPYCSPGQFDLSLQAGITISLRF